MWSTRRLRRERILIGFAWSRAHLSPHRAGTSVGSSSIIAHDVEGCHLRGGTDARAGRISRPPHIPSSEHMLRVQCFIQMRCRKQAKERVTVSSLEASLGKAMCATPDVWISLPEKDFGYTHHTHNSWFRALENQTN